MAYGNLPGGGYSGFLSAEKPLQIKKRSYVPIKDEWPPKFGIYGEEIPESEALLSKEQTKRSKRKRKKYATQQRKELESEIDAKSELDIGTSAAAISREEEKQSKLDKKPRISKRKRMVSFADEPIETATDEEIKEVEKEDKVIIPVPEDVGAIETLKDQLDEEPELYIKFRRTKMKPTFTYYKRKRSIIRFCPCLDRLLHSKRIQYRGLKALLGFPVGALFGFVLYWMVLERIGAAPYYFWMLGIFTGTGFALSTQVRCICFLSVPACFGRAGRAFINTYAIVFLIQGPFTNILANGKEAMRSISCTAALNLNHSMERFQLMFKPVKEIVLDFVGAGDKVQKDTQQLEKTFDNIEEEVREEDEMKENMADIKQMDEEVGIESRVDVIKKKFRRKRKPEFGEAAEKKYGMKSELRCEEVFTKGVRACYDSFGKAYDRCHSYLPIIGYLLCWPMKLTFICDIASSLMGKRSCDSDDVMNPGFGASVDTADGVQSEFEKDFSVQLQYKLVIPEESVNQLVPEDVSGAMKYSFERRKRNLEFFAQVINRILAVLIVLVLNASRKYCNQYLRIIQFDNKYITSYFRHIDARRMKAEKMVLLPLKKAEKLELSDPFAIKLTADEKGLMVMNVVKLVSEFVTVSILLLFDWIFYELLDIIKRHAHVTYQQTGVHHIKMTIYGDGFVGNMVRGILKGFDKKHSADQVTTTEECLPLPTKLPREMILRLYLVFLLMLVLIILESYALRLRRVICSFFYPKREKKRILFLYNDRLKKRRSFLKHMRHRVRKQAREQTIAIDSGVFFSLRKFYPKYFSWLSKIGLGLAKCLICSESESKTCHLISCTECPFSYCSECWEDTEGKCYACLPDYDTEPSEDSLSDD